MMDLDCGCGKALVRNRDCQKMCAKEKKNVSVVR